MKTKSCVGLDGVAFPPSPNDSGACRDAFGCIRKPDVDFGFVWIPRVDAAIIVHQRVDNEVSKQGNIFGRTRKTAGEIDACGLAFVGDWNWCRLRAQRNRERTNLCQLVVEIHFDAVVAHPGEKQVDVPSRAPVENGGVDGAVGDPIDKDQDTFRPLDVGYVKRRCVDLTVRPVDLAEGKVGLWRRRHYCQRSPAHGGARDDRHRILLE